jgi:DNA (cytosine-5)-methyltransferase 1
VRATGLFSGIGGLELGLGKAGIECDLLCENWEPAISVLNARFPSVPKYDDVTRLNGLPGTSDLIVAGFPCQDLSQAGKTAGISGARSGLVGHVFRLIEQARTPYVLLENVPFMLQLDRGGAMRTLTKQFDELGYRWAYRTVDTQSFLPQRRKRVLFFASRGDIDPEAVLFCDEEKPNLPSTDLQSIAHGFYWTEGLRGLGWAPDAVPTLKNGSTVGIPSPPAIMLSTGTVITPDIRDAERLQGFSEDWTRPAELSSRASLRWSLVGNAVSVPVAAWFAERLVDPGEPLSLQEISFDTCKSWPAAAKSDGSGYLAVDIAEYPVWETRTSLEDFLLYPGKPLSPRATAGFLSRTEKAKLRFAEGFQDRLRAHLHNVTQAA